MPLAWRMNPAHTRDPEELPRALHHVHARHRAAADADGRLALRQGAAAVILGNGVVHHVGAPGGRGIRTSVPEAPPEADGAARQPLAPMSHGLCTMSLVPMDESRIAPLLRTSRRSIIPFMINQRQVGACSETLDVDAGALEDPDPRRLIEGVMPKVRQIEDACCAEQLARLPPHDADPKRCKSAADVARLVAGLGGGAHGTLDTAFVSPSLMASLGRGQGGYENVLRAAGVSVISGEAVPEGTMYVTSSRRGPVFVNGPTVMRREGGRLVVARYCAAHGPEGGAPGRGPGFALGAGRMAA